MVLREPGQADHAPCEHLVDKLSIPISPARIAADSGVFSCRTRSFNRVGKPVVVGAQPGMPPLRRRGT